ncbi:MAG: glutamine synthetase beta-grasp domain-containing protein [Methanomicrobiales archaeon]|nr:glutamine synthetase beta-grasp domain-containing protein [Methanomicrobiales archaeon]
MARDTQASILKRIKDQEIKFLRLQFCDIQGQPKNVAIPAIQAEKALSQGIYFDGSSIEGFARIEESDMLLKPDPATFSVLPWRPASSKVARMICDVYTYDDKPYIGDPRYILKRTLEDARKLGYVFNTGPELEFFLFKMMDGNPTIIPQDAGAYFDFAPIDLAENVRRDIVQALEEMGFEIEASHHEVAAGQHEIDFKYGDALRTADNVITYRIATKTIALQQGLHATFMAKPIFGINGSGMHTHCSLAKNGKNAFYDPNRPRELSDLCLHFIGGLLKHVKGITRVANPPINSYKRLVPGYEAPVYISWSVTNRSALIRVPAARGNSTRAEFRSPDPMCNPYLTFACMLAAGLDGIKNRIEPPASTDKNIYEMTPKERKRAKIDTLPGDLVAAMAYLEKDPILTGTLGPHIMENLQRITTLEWDSFRTAVHAWEHDQYLIRY